MTGPGPIPNSYWVDPGRLAAGEYPGAKHPDEARRKIRGLLSAGIRSVLDLTEDGELVAYADLLYEEAARAGLHVRWQRFAVRDVSVPSVATMREILAAIDSALAGGEPVYVHCWGGVGRTGTVVGCYLVERGMTGPDALRHLNELWQTTEKSTRRPRSPETPEQADFIMTWRSTPGVRVSQGRTTGSACPVSPFPEALDRFHGCLLGGAVGDALGAAAEFMSLNEVRRRFGQDGIEDFVPAYGRLGAITDDTQMTLWTAEGLLRGHCRGVQRGILHMSSVVHHAYLRWLKTQGMASADPAFGDATRDTDNGWLIGVRALYARRAPGNTCLSALASSGMGTVERPKNDSKGCGGVMRVASAGLYERDPVRAFDLGCELAAITHGHPTGHLAAGCLSAVIAAIIQGAALHDAVDGAMRILAQKRHHAETTACLERALALARTGEQPNAETVERIGQGWIAEEALAISVYCALAFPRDFRQAVLLAVNHSGDSDSTGAITGNIVGALLGVDAIPADWLARLELRDEIEAIATDLHMQFRDNDEWWQKYPGC